MIFFPLVFPLFWMLECCQVGETEARNRTGRRQLSLLHTRMAAGEGREVPTKKKKKKTQRRYVQAPLWTGGRAAAIWWPATPRSATHFSCFFMGFLRLLFISLNIQIIRTILSCQIKKIYRGSLGFFSTTKKEGMVNTFQREQATVKNTSLNINTIVPTLSEHWIQIQF